MFQKKKEGKICALTLYLYGVVWAWPGILLSPLLVNLNSSINEFDHIVKNIRLFSHQLFLDSSLKT